MMGSRSEAQLGAGSAVLIYLGFAALLWLMQTWIVAGSFRTPLLVIAGLVVLLLMGRVLGNWRNGVLVFLAWLLFEDLVRKYMGNNMTVYFAKDVLVAVVYASFLRAAKSEALPKFRPPFLFSLAMFFLLGVAQVFNSGSPSIFYGLLGLKLYFYYIPLMFVGYAMLRDEEDLRRFLVVNALLAIPIAGLGVAQSVFGLNFLNPRSNEAIDYLGHLTRYTPSGLAVARPPSVFVSDGRFASYVVLAFILAVGAAGYLLLRTTRGRKLVFPALALVGLAAAMSGGRGCAVYVGASALFLSAGMLWGAPPRAAETYRLFKAIRRTFVGVAMSLALGCLLFPEALGAHWQFYAETLDPRSPNYEVSSRTFDYPLHNLSLAFTDPDWPVGHGIGTASLGVQYVTMLVGEKTAAKLPNWGLEEGYATMICELGILGPILWIFWTVSFLIAACRAALRLKGTYLFPVALAIVWYGFLLLFPFTYGGLQPYQNFVMNAYFWLLTGVLFRLPTLNMGNAPGGAQSA